MQSTSKTKDFSVAIVGGGMCGLACAVALLRGGVNVTIFESAERFGEVGAGVGMGPNGLYVMRELGILDAVLAIASEPSKRLFSFISGVGDHQEIFDYEESTGPEAGEGVAVYRPAFLEALVAFIPPGITRFKKHCVSIEKAPSGRQLICFADGTTHETDLVVGADGIKSTIRKIISIDDTDCLRFSNSYSYRALASIKGLKAAGLKVDVEKRPLCWVGLNKHLITYPIKDDVLNVVASTRTAPGLAPGVLPQPWVEEVPHLQLLEAFREWGNDAQIILRHITDPSRWALHTIFPPLKKYSSGATVLIGDAAHGMLPHLSAGIGQGLEDVYVLCRLLTHPRTKRADIEAVLAIYDQLRPPRAGMVLERSARMGEIDHGYGPGKYSAEDMRRHLKGMWEPVWDYDIETDVSEAIKQFDKSNNIKSNL